MATARRKKGIVCAFSGATFLILTIAPLHASFRQTWTAVATTCVPDDGSATLLSYSDTGSVFIKSGVSSATAQLRCPVYPIGDMVNTADEEGGAWALRVILRDTDGTGKTARVIVSLKSVNVSTGAITTYATVDSATFGSASDQYVVAEQMLLNPDRSRMESFFTYSEAYYVDIQMMKTTASANPGVKILQIFNENS
jgi:hypothetical protein